MIFGASMVGGTMRTVMNHGIERDNGTGVSSETIIGMKRCYRIDIIWRRSKIESMRYRSGSTIAWSGNRWDKVVTSR